MESFVSSELTQKLRSQQRGLRMALERLEQRMSTSENPQVAAEVLSVAQLYRVHEALVDALLEAVEPDQPSNALFPEEPLP